MWARGGAEWVGLGLANRERERRADGDGWRVVKLHNRIALVLLQGYSVSVEIAVSQASPNGASMRVLPSRFVWWQ